MYNEKQIKKAKQKIGLYFIDLVQGKTKELGVREIHRKYNVSPQVIDRNLGKSFFKIEGNKKKVFLNKDRFDEVKKFLDNTAKTIINNNDKRLNEILFYTLNEINLG